ncbi:hypothetical protein BCV70DRAFT_207238 [Testicularia cyperi]|uniref:Carboxymuconolactone decarboxylase-like domain-containing protein n=1 Tax=Testicularia cyperi TaxID=1882483 RepID=A0A317XLS5_9BASI|nr:hypothetical protein BCV70DRAFT_207238 [Testicularia cyperi]
MSTSLQGSLSASSVSKRQEAAQREREEDEEEEELAPVTLDEILEFKSQLSAPLQDSGVWYLVILSALVSCHAGAECVVHVYEQLLREAGVSASPNTSDGNDAGIQNGKSGDGQRFREKSLELQRRIQELLVKGSVIYGIPGSLDTMFTLLSHLRRQRSDAEQQGQGHVPLLTASDFSRHHLLSEPLSSLTQGAEEALRRVYQHNLDEILASRMSENMQDLRFLTLEINYGFTLANQAIIDWKHSELVLLSALIPQRNCTNEIKWHLRGAARAGWSLDDIASLRSTAIRIARRCGYRLSKIPSLQDVSENSND